MLADCCLNYFSPFFLVIRTDLKKLYFMTGVDYKPTIFLFNDTQVLDESFLEDINNILSSGEVPNLYKADEFEEVSNIQYNYSSVTRLLCVCSSSVTCLLFFC